MRSSRLTNGAAPRSGWSPDTGNWPEPLIVWPPCYFKVLNTWFRGVDWGYPRAIRIPRVYCVTCTLRCTSTHWRLWLDLESRGGKWASVKVLGGVVIQLAFTAHNKISIGMEMRPKLCQHPLVFLFKRCHKQGKNISRKIFNSVVARKYPATTPALEGLHPLYTSVRPPRPSPSPWRGVRTADLEQGAGWASRTATCV